MRCATSGGTLKERTTYRVTLQDLILKLSAFWASHGCLLQQPLVVGLLEAPERMRARRRQIVARREQGRNASDPGIPRQLEPQILAVQHWMQTNYLEDCSVTVLADRASMGARTFLRRFMQATGSKPSEYLQRLKIARRRT